MVRGLVRKEGVQHGGTAHGQAYAVRRFDRMKGRSIKRPRAACSCAGLSWELRFGKIGGVTRRTQGRKNSYYPGLVPARLSQGGRRG